MIHFPYNKLRSCALALIISVCCSVAMAAPKVIASLDSAYILMGKQTIVHIESSVPEMADNVSLIIPSDTLTDKVEIIASRCDTGAVNNGLRQLRHDIIIQSFDSGLYAIPPFRLVVNQDTFLSNHLILKVVPVDVDSLQGQIHPNEGVIAPERKFWDFIPDWLIGWGGWLLLGVLLLSFAFAAYYYLVVQKRNPFRKPIVIVPPYDEAMAALQQLRNEHLCENGHEREFYTRLTEILRIYLFRRFNISAMEMTSSQILRSLSDNNETKWSRQQIQEVLTMADFVKFAKMRPLPDDNIRTFKNVENFVENTRPVPETISESTEQDSVKLYKNE